MDSEGVRRRGQAQTRHRESSTNESDTAAPHNGHEIPTYVIDLSLPPVERYQHVAADFKAQAAALPALFDEIILGMKPNARVDRVRKLARLVLRRVYYDEESEELRGISMITGIEMWLLVAFNVLLDLFMGCTSGAARVAKGQEDSKMLHFRTLDWGMDPLRKVVVQLDFIEKGGGRVIASSVTYVGYVGVLTGVRKGLSMSLNFRPNHDRSTRLANFRFYSHHLLVLLGYRPSISSLLRQQLLPSQTSSRRPKATQPTLESVECTIPGTTTTAAYLTFSDGDRTIAMEKDHRTALVKSSSAFIVTTNHDEAEEASSELQSPHNRDLSQTLEATGMEGLTEDSIYRKKLFSRLWEKPSKKSRRKGSRAHRPITRDTVVEWINIFPITNEQTHYATIMDPKAGEVVWAQRYLEPLE